MTSLVHEILEYFSHVVVIWSLLKLQVPAIIKIGVELLWHTPSKRLNGGAYLLVLDPVILVIFIFPLETLPRKCALEEVY
jgi:hypothetical protein